MEDRYLFRGKVNGEWKIGSLDQSTNEEAPMIRDNITYHFVEGKTIGQCTGLRDKNRTLIFEGDIIISSDQEHRYNFGRCVVLFSSFVDEECDSVYESYNRFGFHFKFNSGVCSQVHPEYISNFEIVGNMHDNPELLL